MKKSLVDLKQNPFYTHYIYYPFGTGLIYNAFTPLHGVFSIPFQLLFGLTTAHNIVLILSLIAAAFGTFFLCYELCRDKKYSIIGSILFAFSPFVMERIQMHINLSDVFPIVWFVLFFVKAHKKPLLNFILFSSVFLFFIFLTDYYYLFYTLLFIGIYIIFFRTRALFFTTCKILTIFLIVTSPFLIMFIHDYQNLNFYEIYQDARALSPDLFRFVIPSWQNQHLLRWYELIYNKVGRNIDGETYYFGLIPLGFLIFSVIKLFRKNIWIKFFTFVFFIFFIFALGPTLKIGGENTNLLLPFSLLQQTPMLRELRVSGRFIIYCYLALAVIVSITLKKLLYKSQVLWKRIGILFVFLVVLIEYWPGTIQLEKFEDYPVYQTIKDDKDNFSVLEIPIPFWSDYNRIMYFQTIHEKPIIGGMVSRVPKSIVELYHQDALLDNIVFLEFQDSTKNEIR
ncbi:MAG: hypothetical protein EPN88_07625, partial [Bacteroidetes bacterium]